MAELFNTFVHIPLYNALVWILSLGSWMDVGIAVIMLTVLVKLALFPLSMKAARTQRLMKEIEEPMKEIREKYKDKKEEQGRKMLELYRENGINPFSGFVVLFIQLPVIIGLYYIFMKGGLPEIDTEQLYSFVTAPENVSMLFLGFVDLAGKSIPFAVLAGISQFFQAHFALPKSKPRKENATFQEDFARSMQVNMKFVFPILIGFMAYAFNAAVALYWITSSIFAIGQEIVVKRQIEDRQTVPEKETDEK